MHLLPLLALAAAFWGATPACGTPSIETARLGPVGEGLFAVGYADLPGCRIVIDPTRLTWAGSTCMVVLHEYGHELGYGHSSDPNNVMYPLMRKPVWPCAW